MKTHRTLLIVVNLLLFAVACFLFSATANSQSMPSYLSRDPEYWWRQWQVSQDSLVKEKAHSAELATVGMKAINGLQVALDSSSARIVSLKRENRALADSANVERTAKQMAEWQRDQLQEKQPKNWIQRVGVDVMNGFKVLGIATAVYIGIGIIKP